MIEAALPGAAVEVIDETGTGDHLRATVSAPQFEGLSRIDQHRLVKAAVKERFDDGTIHALSVKTTFPASLVSRCGQNVSFTCATRAEFPPSAGGMESMRSTWTDSRLDDLNGRCRLAPGRAEQTRMDLGDQDRLPSAHDGRGGSRTLVAILATDFMGLAGLIATQL